LTAASPPGATALPARRATWIAYLVAGAFFMENLDGTIITTALPAMAHSFDTTPVALNVGMSAYLLTLAAFIPSSGWVADRFGSRTVFSLAVTVFTIASLFCAISVDLLTFTLARVMEGVGGAMMVPVGRMVVMRNTEKHEIMRAVATITWPGLAAPVLGPPIGGLITTYTSWRWIFLLNLPLGVIALVLAMRLIPNAREGGDRPFDWTGFLLSGLACFGLMAGLERAGTGAERVGWEGQGSTVAILIGSAVLGWLAIRHAHRHPRPMLDLRAVRHRSFVASILGGTLFRTSLSAIPFLLPLLFQLCFHLDPFQSGLLVLTLFGGNIGIKPLTSWVLRRMGFRRTLLLNGLVATATMFACALLSPSTPVVLVVLLLVVHGAARSMQFTSIATLAFVDVERPAMGGASTLFSMMQQMAFGLGIAVGALLLRTASLFDAPDTPTPSLHDFRWTFIVIGMIALIGLLDFRGLDPRAGEAVSGYRRREATS
jgi:EmrB/QacA subfamily drug resistance transporter